MAPSLQLLVGVWTSQFFSDSGEVILLGGSGIESTDGLDIGWVVAVDMVAEPVMVDR